MSSGSLLPLRPLLRLRIVLVGARCVISDFGYLDAPPIPTNLLRTGLDAIWRRRFGIRHNRLGKGMLFFSRAVADALEGAITIRRARLILTGTDNFFSFFVLPGRPARLADIHKGRASTVFSPSFLIRFFLLHAGFGSKPGTNQRGLPDLPDAISCQDLSPSSRRSRHPTPFELDTIDRH